MTPAQVRESLSRYITCPHELDNAVRDILHRRPLARPAPAEDTDEAAQSEEADHRDEMEKASALLCDAISKVRLGHPPSTPKALVWSSKSGVESSNSHGANWHLYNPAEQPRRVDSRVCFRCGVRAEVGCKHLRVA